MGGWGGFENQARKVEKLTPLCRFAQKSQRSDKSCLRLAFLGV